MGDVTTVEEWTGRLTALTRRAADLAQSQQDLVDDIAVLLADVAVFLDAQTEGNDA